MSDNDTCNNGESVDKTKEMAPTAKGFGISELAEAIVNAFKDQALEVRQTDSNSYRIIGTKENGNINWKKGLIYVINKYATGNHIELQLYSPKKGAHLAEFKDEFNQFNGVKIGEESVEQLAFGLATRLRLKLPCALGLEKAAELGAEFIKLVNGKVEEIRAKITLPEKPAKKSAKVKATPTEGKAAAKKGGEKKGGAKSKSKVAVIPAAPASALDPGITTVIDDISTSVSN